MRERVRVRLGGPAGPLWAGLIALALALPSATLAPMLDDHGFRRRITIEQGGLNAAFEFTPQEPDGLRRRGPWWFDPAPVRRFLRPLSGATHWVDFRLWSDATWWMRVQNSLLYALLAALAALAYGRLGLSGWAVAFAALMFAVDEAHANSLTLVAGRNTLLSAAFGLCALPRIGACAQAAGRTHGLLGPACFALALLSGEGGLCALGYLVAYALCLDPRSRAERVRSLVPYGLAVLPWAAVYVRGGYGAGDGRFYRDPIADPLGTLAQGLLDLPVWIASQLTLGYATVSLELQPWIVRLASTALLLALAPLLWPSLRDRPLARFFALGFVLSLAPLLLTVPQERLLVLGSFGAFGLLGCVLERAAAPRPARIGLLAVHLGLAPLLFVPTYLLSGRIARAENTVDRALPRDARAAATDVVIVRAPIIGTLGYALTKRGGRGQPLPRTSYELFASGAPVRLTRIDDRTLELEPRGGFCQSRAECIGTRAPEGFRQGQVIALQGMRVEVRELTPRGTPLRVRFTFPSGLEDPSRRWLSWTSRGLLPFVLPAIGETRTLPAMSALDAFR